MLIFYFGYGRLAWKCVTQCLFIVKKKHEATNGQTGISTQHVEHKNSWKYWMLLLPHRTWWVEYSESHIRPSNTHTHTQRNVIFLCVVQTHTHIYYWYYIFNMLFSPILLRVKYCWNIIWTRAIFLLSHQFHFVCHWQLHIWTASNVSERIHCGTIVFDTVRWNGYDWSSPKNVVRLFEHSLTSFVEMISHIAQHMLRGWCTKWLSFLPTLFLQKWRKENNFLSEHLCNAWIGESTYSCLDVCQLKMKWNKTGRGFINGK